MRLVLFLDGEHTQVRNALTPEIFALCKEHLIEIAKSPASCSSTNQSADVGNRFKASKIRLKHVGEQDIIDVPMYNRLKGALDLEKISQYGMSAELKNKLCIGIMRIRRALYDTETISVCVHSFSCWGQWPLDFSLTCRSGKGKLTKPMLDVMIASQDAAATEFLRLGRLTEEWMDTAGIPSCNRPDAQPKDVRAIPNQRAMWLTCANTVQLWTERAEQKEAATTMKAALHDDKLKGKNIKALGLEKLKIEMAIEKDRLAEEKKATKAVDDAQKKAAYNLLAPADKKRFRDAAQAQVVARRADKAEAKQARLAELAEQLADV